MYKLMVVQGLILVIFLQTSVNMVATTNEGPKLAAFNVQVFGVAKVKKPEVVEVLVKIIQRYDIILIQEIRDISNTAIHKLLEAVNNGPIQYDMIISPRLGRTSSKEQYAFFYRKDVGISIRDTYQYPDPDDVFEREPYAVKFHVPYSATEDFVLVAIHADPDVAEQEIDALIPVHDDIARRWSTDNILIMGDINADSPYVTKTEMKNLELRKEGYHWLVPDTADTTVAATDAAYDRFVMTGEEFVSNVVTDSVKVFRFDLEYDLTLEDAKKVSDHYPIELTLKPADTTSSAESRQGMCMTCLLSMFACCFAKSGTD